MPSPLIVPHFGGCRNRLKGHSDAAKRISDHINQYTQSQGIGIVWETVQNRWMGFDLNDGRSDGVLYDTQSDAARHTDPYKHFYVKLRADLMTVCEAELLLTFHRQARLNGFPQADPEGRTPELIPRLGTSEVRNQIRSLRRGM